MLEHGVEANVVSYTALIRACAKSGDVDRANYWFAKMHEVGVNANAVTYCAILNVCAKAGSADKAEQWFKMMESKGIEINTICYNCVIDACAKAQEPERAELWMRGLKDSGLQLTPPSYTTTAQAFAAKGDADNTERILMEMEDDGLPMDAHCLTVLLSAYGRARPRLHTRAVEAFREYVSKGMVVTKPPIRVLRSIIGKQRTEDLCSELNVQIMPESFADFRKRPSDESGPKVSKPGRSQAVGFKGKQYS
jgi:pentatricopeptide repeat protein